MAAAGTLCCVCAKRIGERVLHQGYIRKTTQKSERQRRL